MTTSPVVTITDELVAELEALAISIKGWNMPEAFQEPDAFEVEKDWEWHVGMVDEDGDRYPLLHVNAHQYDSEDSEKLARYYAACNRNFILALLAERAAMQSQINAGIVTQENLELYRKDALRYQWLSKRISVSQYHVLGAELSSNTVEGVGEAIDQAMQEQQP